MSRIGWEYPEDVKELEEDIGLRGRLAFLRLFILMVMFLLLYRVFWLQQIEGETLRGQAQENQSARITTDAARGVIFDRNGQPLAENLPSFDVTITPAFLPDDPAERDAIFARLAVLTGVPITNTAAQQRLRIIADPEEVGVSTQLAQLFNASIEETLDNAGIVQSLPTSIENTVQTFSFDQFSPAVITDNVPITTAFAIEMESTYMPGVQVIEKPIRHYPSAEYTAHLIGYMGPLPDQTFLEAGRGYESDDRVGLAGLESSQELKLRGTKGEEQIVVDWSGRKRQQLGEITSPIAGNNVYLTLDLELQKKTQEILEGWLWLRRRTPDRDQITGEETFPEVEQAAVVVLNPNTGEVLAMVSLPTFDNTRFATEIPVDYYLGLFRNDYTPLLNHAIGGAYPPGSVFKLITAAGALQEGIVSPNRLLNAPGDITIPNRFAPEDPGRSQQFVCWNREGHGLMNMWGGLANSCDIYFYKVNGGFDQDGETVDALGVRKLREYSISFGMGRTQGIELPAESPGLIPSRQWKRQTQGEGWSTGDDYNMAIGQGAVLATPLQIAQMAAVVANKGFLYKPTIIHHITDSQGNIVQDFEPVILNAVDVDRDYLDIIAEGMFLVTQPPETHPQIDGGGTAARVPWLDEFGIVSAGKTGTSEYCDNIAIKRRWCRFEDVINKTILPTHSWYVGYAPYENPEIVVAVFIFNGGEGSVWAASLARDVMAAYFEVDQFAPGETPFTPEYFPVYRARQFENLSEQTE